jgi:hypothetical protein
MIDPRSLPRGSSPEPTSNPVTSRRKEHPWAWIVGTIVVLLLVWGFFGIDHLKPAVNPAIPPPVSVSAVG